MRDFSERCEFVEDRLRRYDLLPTGQSRFGQMIRAIRDDPRGEMALDGGKHSAAWIEALRDILQLDFVLRTLSLDSLPSPWPSRLRQLLHDDLHPSRVRQSEGRDLQCELLAAAIASAAGMSPELHEQPDLHVTIGGDILGVAVKRCKVLKQFERNIRRAAAQVLASGLPGLVLCDVTVALDHAHDYCLLPLSDAAYLKARERQFRCFVTDHIRQIHDWTDGTRVNGLILVQHRVRLSPETGWELNSMNYFVSLSQSNQARQRRFDTFCALYQRGLAICSEA